MSPQASELLDLEKQKGDAMWNFWNELGVMIVPNKSGSFHDKAAWFVWDKQEAYKEFKCPTRNFAQHLS